MHLAERTQWHMTAKILWAFDILRDTDPATWKIVDIDPDAYHEDISHCPGPFKVKFMPRSQKHADTIEKEAENGVDYLKVYK